MEMGVRVKYQKQYHAKDANNNQGSGSESKMKDYFVGILWVFAIGISNLAFGEDLPPKNSLVDDIYPILNKLYPNTDVRIVTKVDKSECEITGNQPGVITSDFNGDGKSDYAVLVQLRKVKGDQKKLVKDEDFEGVDINLLALIQTPSGSFDKFILKKTEGYWTGMVFIALEAPGIVHDTETSRPVRLKNPGVAMEYCGKSRVDFYWHGRGFKQVWISD